MVSGGGFRAVAVVWLRQPAMRVLQCLPIAYQSRFALSLFLWVTWFLFFLASFATARALEGDLPRRKWLGLGDAFAWALGIQFLLVSLPWDRTVDWWGRAIPILYYPAMCLDHSQNVEANIGAPALWIGPAMIAYAMIFAVLVLIARQLCSAQPGLAPNSEASLQRQLAVQDVPRNPPSVR
jgi:hypothetical protein